jgi:hypothetical protein
MFFTCESPLLARSIRALKPYLLCVDIFIGYRLGFLTGLCQ